MRTSHLLAIVCCMACGLSAPAAQPPAVRIDTLGTINMRAQSIRERPGQDSFIGGLTMAVSENTWPLVMQFPLFSGYAWAQGNAIGEDGRNVWADLQWGYVTPVDLVAEPMAAINQGPFRPALIRFVLDGRSLNTVLDKRVVSRDWVHIRYRYRYANDRTLDALYSRLTPAFLFAATGDRLRMFATNRISFQLSGRPDKEVGGCDWTRLTRALIAHIDKHPDEYHPYQIQRNLLPHAAYGGSTIDYVNFAIRPTAMAFATPQGMAVRGGNIRFSGDDMAEPWLLVWHGGGSPLMATTHPGLPGPRTSNYGLHQMDCPFLVILEKRPRQVTLDKDGLLLEYPGQAGRVVMLPLRGVDFFEATDTESWRTSGELPAAVVAQCRAWTSRLLDFPVSVRQEAQVNADGSVSLRDEFTYESLKTDWNFPRTRIAPVSPIAATALSFDFPARFDQGPVNSGIFTKFGKYMVVEGASQYTCRIDGMGRYVDMRPALRPPADARETALVEAVRREVQRMIEGGHLAPLVTFDLTYLYTTTHFDSPGELLYSAAAVADLLTPQTRAQLKAWLLNSMEKYPPLAGARFPVGEGKSRAPYWVPPGRAGELAISQASTLQMYNRRPNLPYQLWWFAEKLDGWDYVAAHWDEVRAYFHTHLGSSDWATSFLGTLRCHAPNAGFLLGIHDINSFLAGAIGFTRMAEKLGKTEDAALGRALCAKWLMTRFAYTRFEQSLLAEGVARESPNVRLPGGWWQQNIVDRAGFQQVYAMTQFGIMIDRQGLGFGWGGGQFKNLTPEVCRFLTDYNARVERSVIDDIRRRTPMWHLSGGILPPSPERSLEYLTASAWLDSSPAGLARFVDTPDVVGDLYFLQKVAAVLQTLDAGAADKR